MRRNLGNEPYWVPITLGFLLGAAYTIEGLFKLVSRHYDCEPNSIALGSDGSVFVDGNRQYTAWYYRSRFLFVMP